MVSSLGSNSHNKRFKRDSQRVAFLLCVGFCDYGVMRKVGSGVVCPLSGRYKQIQPQRMKNGNRVQSKPSNLS
nr:DUF3265 domain-containing protein [Vibrio sp. B1-2]